MGSVAEWDEAERVLTDCLTAANTPFELNPGDGAFYGPKIGVISEIDSFAFMLSSSSSSSSYCFYYYYFV
jgi:hypothetical protein